MWVVLWIVSVLLPPPPTAQPAPPTPEPDPPTPHSLAAGVPAVSLVTFGPGDAFFEVFGHNGLLVRYPPDTGRPPVLVDWGRFDLAAPGFVRRFVFGDMRYEVGAADADAVLAAYAELDREVTLRPLRLTAAETDRLLARLDENLRPENRAYGYDYYLANCSTEARDALDHATGGLLAAAMTGTPAGTTLRAETDRHAAAVPWMWFLLHAGQGRPTDEPIDAWTHAFLPAALDEAVGAIERPDGTPLAGPAVVWHDAVRPPARDAAPGWGWGVPQLVVGGLVGLLAAGFARLRATRWLGRLVAGGYALVAGLGAWLLLFMGAFTRHDFASPNLAAAWLGPLLPLVGLALLTPLARRLPRATAGLAAASLALAVLATLALAVPALWQGNGTLALLTLPAQAGVLAACLSLANSFKPADPEPS